MNLDSLSRTILIVEDNEDDLFAVTRALKKARVSNPVRVVTDGREAIDYLAGNGPYADRAEFPLPFLIFMDLKLPSLTGFQIMEWIRSQFHLSTVVVVALTSSDEPRDHQRAYALGARSYLVKPPTAEDLKQVLDSLKTVWDRYGAPGPFLTEAA
jgi:CheY-like chemotaxis protein